MARVPFIARTPQISANITMLRTGMTVAAVPAVTLTAYGYGQAAPVNQVTTSAEVELVRCNSDGAGTAGTPAARDARLGAVHASLDATYGFTAEPTVGDLLDSVEVNQRSHVLIGGVWQLPDRGGTTLNLAALRNPNAAGVLTRAMLVGEY